MSKRESFQVAGVDGCRAGWFVVIASVRHQGSRATAPCVFKLNRFFVTSNFAELLSEMNDCKLVCVDIPIGLSDGDKPRECDVAARKLLGRPRASSVFPPPIRQCLPAKDYAKASEISFQHSGRKLNRQSFGLLDKIRQVDSVMTPQLQERVREVHPEVSFWALNNKKPIQQSKRTVPGQAQRHKLLQRIFGDMDNILSKSPPRGCVMDDALDAFVAAWTAGQTVMGRAETLPGNPQRDGEGLKMEILCPARIRG